MAITILLVASVTEETAVIEMPVENHRRCRLPQIILRTAVMRRRLMCLMAYHLGRDMPVGIISALWRIRERGTILRQKSMLPVQSRWSRVIWNIVSSFSIWNMAGPGTVIWAAAMTDLIPVPEIGALACYS